jgi:hypothetical protein
VGFSQTLAEFGHFYEGTRARADVLERRLQAHVSTLSLDVRTPWQTRFGAVLPLGAITLEDRFESTAATGISDAQLWVRQDFSLLLIEVDPRLPRITVGLGLVAPTGVVVHPDDSIEANREKARRLGLVRPTGESFGDPILAGEVFNLAASLGRGAWWLAAEVELGVPITPWLGATARTQGRFVIHDGRSEVQWGHEVFTMGSVSVQPGVDWLVLQAGLSHEWRAASFEYGGKVRIASSGGHWLFFEPAVVLDAGGVWALRLGGRVPVYRDVQGFQLVESWSALAAVSLRFDFSAAPPVLHEEPGAAPMALATPSILGAVR